MTNPLNYIEKYPDRTKQIIGIDRQQWLSLLEITALPPIWGKWGKM